MSGGTTQRDAGQLHHSAAVLWGRSKWQLLETAKEASDAEGGQSVEHSTVVVWSLLASAPSWALGWWPRLLRSLHNLVEQRWS